MWEAHTSNPNCWKYLGLDSRQVGFYAQDRSSHRASLLAQKVENLPVMQGIRLGSLGQKDPLEKGVATHSSILAWRIPWTKELGGLQSMGSPKRVGHDWVTNIVIKNI